jgi:hypothetical protein
VNSPLRLTLPMRSMPSPAVRLGRMLFALSRAVCLCLIPTAAQAQGDFQGSTHMMPFDEDTINYGKAADHSPIARLQEQINKGEVHLEYDPQLGYLPALFKALGVSPASQMLVFSKTSFQRERINPKNPRALFFNDEIYLGYVMGSPLLEISAVDPKLGGVFYTLEQKPADKPRFTRTDQCLECHASAKTMGVPGHLVRSFNTDIGFRRGVHLTRPTRWQRPFTPGPRSHHRDFPGQSSNTPGRTLGRLVRDGTARQTNPPWQPLRRGRPRQGKGCA